jgi:hypothetical protein
MDMKKILCAGVLLAASTVAHAGTCEQDFQAVGDPRNGLLFMGQVEMPGLSVRSALGQLQQIAKDSGYEVGNESIAGDSGELFFTQTNTRPPIVVRAQADSSGQVSLGTKLPRGQKLEVAEARREICSLLSRLKAGKEGDAIAAAAHATIGSGRIIDAEAPKLSAEIGSDIRKTMAGVNSKGMFKNLMLGTNESATAGERGEAFAPIRAKYMGRNYRIDGQIYTVSKNQFNGEMQVAYLVTKTRGLLGVRQSSTYNSLNFTIACTLAPDQAKLFVTLAEGDWVKLTGIVDQIDTEGMELRDCRQAQ